MSISDKINLCLCILSFILAVISVVTVVITLKQNNKMIENSTRPYIGVYSQKTDFGSLKYFLVLKNFGTSQAVITDFKCNIDLSKYTLFYNISPFEHIIGTSIFPQQSIMRNLDLSKLQQDKIENIKIHIEYMGEDKYFEDIDICVAAENENNMTRIHKNNLNNEIEIISTTLQGIGERLL